MRACARSISATDENLKMLHLATLEYLLRLGGMADISTGCSEISATFSSSVLSSDGTFRPKVIGDVMPGAEEAAMDRPHIFLQHLPPTSFLVIFVF